MRAGVLLTTGTTVAFLALLGIGGLWIDQRNTKVSAATEAARQACLVGNQTRAQIANVFEFMRITIAAQNPDESAERRAQTADFFDEIANRLRPVPCEKGAP